MLEQAQIDSYNENGFLVISGLFSSEEIEFFKDHYEGMRQHEHGAQLETAVDTDPLQVYPRIMQPHRRDEASLRWFGLWVTERLPTAACLCSRRYPSCCCAVLSEVGSYTCVGDHRYHGTTLQHVGPCLQAGARGR